MFRNEFLVKNHDEWCFFKIFFLGKVVRMRLFYLKLNEDKQRTET